MVFRGSVGRGIEDKRGHEIPSRKGGIAFDETGACAIRMDCDGFYRICRGRQWTQMPR